MQKVACNFWLVRDLMTWYIQYEKCSWEWELFVGRTFRSIRTHPEELLAIYWKCLFSENEQILKNLGFRTKKCELMSAFWSGIRYKSVLYESTSDRPIIGCEMWILSVKVRKPTNEKSENHKISYGYIIWSSNHIEVRYSAKHF